MYSLVVRGKGATAAPSEGGDDAGASTAAASPAAPASGEAGLQEVDQVPFSAGNPRVEHITGVVHLYRHIPAEGVPSPTASQEGASQPALPEGRGKEVCVLALPPDMGFPEFCTFLGGYFDRVKEVRLVRRETGPSACLVLLGFDEQQAADGFYTDFNGKAFCLLEPELLCQLVFIKGLELSSEAGSSTPATSAATATPSAASQPQAPPPLRPPPGATELPSCPVCLERLDAHVSGVVTTVCNHKFHNECLRRWGDTSCPVCRYCQSPGAVTSHCSACKTAADLWICLICGHVGCGRYRGSHAHAHWQDSGHGYALELESQRVWAYASDAYVHRLVRSKTDGKLVEVPAPGGLQQRGSSGEDCGGAEEGRRCSSGAGGEGECWVDPDVEEAMVLSKLDALASEYNHLLVTQLESQRQYFEGLLVRQRVDLEAAAAEAGAGAAAAQLAASETAAAAAEADRKRRQAEAKLGEVSKRLDKAQQEKQFLKQLNDTLLANQKDFAAKLKAAEAEAAKRDVALADLQDQVRDLMVFIEARQTIENSGGGEVEGGTLLPVPEAKGRPGGGKGRRR